MFLEFRSVYLQADQFIPCAIYLPLVPNINTEISPYNRASPSGRALVPAALRPPPEPGFACLGPCGCRSLTRGRGQLSKGRRPGSGEPDVPPRSEGRRAAVGNCLLGPRRTSEIAAPAGIEPLGDSGKPDSPALVGRARARPSGIGQSPHARATSPAGSSPSAASPPTNTSARSGPQSRIAPSSIRSTRCQD